ncbi:LCP family protein [Saliterribacillus persicus]|uniref:LytR family transcriptional attenuator n=1 Tax=Saliterribacillus persicus TaxID=930114 RepID=A0A368YB16_9BACI|nr:LCP family protein [Saliterribacillus persicus]RCW77392.1 LytR family transcriptional attenuator [Saliterribacillus persicus]
MERKEMRKLQKKQGRRKKLRVFLSVFILALIIGIGTGVYLIYETYQAASDTYDELERGEKSEKREQAVSISNDPISILMMGVENYTSDGDHGRSDTLMVATFNPEDEHLKLLSIPRDTLVDIPGRDNRDKINHSFAFGGKELTIKTVENFLDIPIDYYATVNFEGFKAIVDTLGGITVDVPFEFEQNSDDRVAEKLQFREGEMDLNGRYALAYARMRKADPAGDFGRNERQKQVIEAIIKEVTSVSTVTKVDDLGKDLGENVETNMKVSEGLSFLKKYSNFRTSNIEQLKLDGYDDRIDGVYYYVPDETSLANIQNELKNHLDLNNTSSLRTESTNIEEAAIN